MLILNFDWEKNISLSGKLFLRKYTLKCLWIKGPDLNKVPSKRGFRTSNV